MYRYAAILAPLVSLSCAAESLIEAPANHQDFMQLLLSLLTNTEQALASCTDEASVAAALPRLRLLAEQARALSAQQKQLPEPTVQDYMSAHPHVAEFNKLWEAICGHIERLEMARLISPELRDVLQLGPSAT